MSAFARDVNEVQVERAKLDTKDMFGIQRDPDVIGIAPPMPTRLIRPFKSPQDMPADGAPKIPSISWGVQAVGATLSHLTGSGVTVGVLDTGIDSAHQNLPSFAGVEIETRNFTSEPDGDLDGHGTHCAGTIFGRTTDGCRIGVAPGVGRALIGKVIGQGSSTDAVFKGILWAYQSGAQVISMSLGIDFVQHQAELSKVLPQDLATSMALAGYRANVRLFDRLAQLLCARDAVVAGAVVVAAAGNESQRDVHPAYRITASPPAAAELFLSVAALGQGVGEVDSYVVAPFSNTGARLSAPGVGILSSKLGGGLEIMSGTSMATPHVAGVAALWIEKLKKQGRPFRAAEVVDWIERSVKPLPYLDPDDVGLGMVQAPNAK